MAKIRYLASALLAAVFTFGAQASTVFVADENGRSITIIDTLSATSRRIEVPISPHNVDLTQDGTRLLITGLKGGHGGQGGHQSAVDGQLVVVHLSGEPPRARSINIGGHPAHVVPDREGRFAYVTDAETNSVVVADLASMSVVGRVPVGSYPHGLRLSPDGRILAVADMKGGTVSLVDVIERKPVAAVEVGRRPVQVGFDPTGRFVVVSLNGENKVGVIDVTTRKVLWKADVGRNPVQVLVTPDGGRILVANQGSAADPDDRLSIVAMVTRKTVDTVKVQKGAHGVALDPQGKTAFVTNTYSDTVSVVDLGTLSVTSNYATGKGPNGVAVR